MKTLQSAARLLTGTLVALASSAALAVGTPAGTNISNTASASYTLPGGTTTQTKSSTVSLTVLELINVNVTSQNGANVSTSAGATDQVLTFVVTNTGNAVEDFVLTLTQSSSEEFDMTNAKIFEDTDGSGTYTSGDTEIASGTGSIGLDANSTTEAAATIFIVGVTPTTRDDSTALVSGDLSQLTLEAISETVDNLGTTPTPGQRITGVGSGGAPDAVVGTSYMDDANGVFEIGTGSGTATINITKSIVAVVDPFGGSTYVPGSTVTYQIDVSVANGDVDNLVISDEIPGNMDYVAGSITLDGGTLTDDSDTDVGVFDSTSGTSGTVTIDLSASTYSAGTSFVVQLQAEIK
ncbi:isopeptide-forming domain-containing fimbrial protein [Oceanobacter mangrovi]|uniref:isopeptide-forming domain-containing fimbrial protein n=1 Tax=Oceanobacter mangrovi TaxID=2862510 RepID=UPI001C8D418B|nr:isopeptide-forming domain-containing fimbrial protein [Oceanobacter mangrovi]